MNRREILKSSAFLTGGLATVGIPSKLFAATLPKLSLAVVQSAGNASLVLSNGLLANKATVAQASAAVTAVNTLYTSMAQTGWNTAFDAEFASIPLPSVSARQSMLTTVASMGMQLPSSFRSFQINITAEQFASAKTTIGKIETAQQRAVAYLSGILEELEVSPDVSPVIGEPGDQYRSLPPRVAGPILMYPGMSIGQSLGTISLGMGAWSQVTSGEEPDLFSMASYIFGIAAMFF